MKRISLFAVLFLSLSLLPASALGAAAATQPATQPAATPRALIEQVNAQVLAALSDKQLTVAQKRRRIEEIAYAHIDFETLARLGMARAWRDLPEGKQQELVTEVRKHLSTTYAHIARDYADEKLATTGDREEARGDWTVLTRILSKDRGETKVDYRLRKKENRWMVIDVTIEGISLVANLRSQLQEMMASGGIEKVLDALRQKNAQAARESQGG